MSVSAIGSTAVTASLPELQKPAPAAAPSTPSSPPAATVTLSDAAHAAARSVDVDHDGDSH